MKREILRERIGLLKKRSFLASSVLGLIVMAACGNGTVTTYPKPRSESADKEIRADDTKSAPPEAAGPDARNAEGQAGTGDENAIDRGVHIDWDRIDSPLWNAEMQPKLNAVLEALAQKDAEKLNLAVRSDTAGAFDDLLAYEFDFRAVTDVVEERGRLLVGVSHIVRMTDDIPREGVYYYYFDQSESGEWEIVAID
ncbi:hypothetical protein QWJ34_23385 [Saccharibacillus sp. CPCC 101409]|uniref:hypothetical protein n=1 Tax=Saccharibacillus sp. CPCC 101409 TaxID=3058041 RepID=UPI002673992E|nr:hypothetical protein [Saccharibacillus sp. CPCC 101409]MDO3412730.1 hypothetical protein [Saccharibacillus sp. CPCC 101409]